MLKTKYMTIQNKNDIPSLYEQKDKVTLLLVCM